MEILLLTIVLLAFAFIGIAIKMFVKKDGQFTRTCSKLERKEGEECCGLCEKE